MIGEMQTCSLQTICLSSLGMYITFSSIVLSSKNTAYIGTKKYNSPCKKFPIESISILTKGTEQYFVPLIYPYENPPVKYKYINQPNWTIYIFL